MKTMLLLGGVTLTASSLATTASAKNYEFTFYSSSGAAYCDGVKFDYADGVLLGYHIYDGTSCTEPPAFIAGVESKVPLVGPGKWFFFTQAVSSYNFYTFMNVKALQWALFYESTDYGITFSELNAGTLVKGPPPKNIGVKSLGTIVQAGLAHLKR